MSTYQDDLDLLKERSELREDRNIEKHENKREELFLCVNKEAGTNIFTCNEQCDYCLTAQDRLNK